MIDDDPNVKEVIWNQTVVRLDNRFKVNESLLRQVVEKADLGERRVLLRLDAKEDASPGYGYRGAAFSKEGVLTEGNYAIRERIGTLNLEYKSKWNYLVYIPHISAKTWSNYKPYFVSVLAHELTHVWIMIQDLKFHLCTSWLDKAFAENFIEPKPRDYEVPWEEYCHKKGKSIALNICDEQKVRDGLCEYAKFLGEESSDHAETVKWLRKLDCSDVNSEDILSLKKKTRLFCKKWRESLLQHWKQERDECSKSWAWGFELSEFI